MYNFKAYHVNVIKSSPYAEGDKNEYMEAFIRVYKDGVYDYLGISEIYVYINGDKSYFKWCDRKEHKFNCLRNSAFEVIKACIDSVQKSSKYQSNTMTVCTEKSYENRKFLDGIAHDILNSLIA